MKRIRKNISLLKEDYNLILEYVQSNNYTFSGFLRDVAINYIKEKENINLLETINSQVSYVDAKEQEEIEKLNLDFSSLDGKEITIDYFL